MTTGATIQADKIEADNVVYIASYHACLSFVDDPTAPGFCAGCGWLDEDHDFDGAPEPPPGHSAIPDQVLLSA
ncbi:MAG: hypothetical protein KDB86_11445 [Actinobacteria bacterium]|nr:hypothetical protein [Actinomycetota bacterium]MCB9389001.1 hypothetical protein [Acidimicrobiia bacterium]